MISNLNTSALVPTWPEILFYSSTRMTWSPQGNTLGLLLFGAMYPQSNATKEPPEKIHSATLAMLLGTALFSELPSRGLRNVRSASLGQLAIYSAMALL